MAELSASEPPLSNRAEEPVSSRSPRLSICLGRWVLKILMWAIFICWVGIIFLYPTEFMQSWFREYLQATEGTIFGITDSIFLIFSAPILVIAILACAYVAIFAKERYQKKTPKFPSFRLRTFPILVDGPFGVVSAAEFIGIVLFVAYVLWSMSIYTIQTESRISSIPLPSKVKSKRYMKSMLVFSFSKSKADI